MWLMTTMGMFSAVAHRDIPDSVLVRTRARGDADALASWARDTFAVELDVVTVTPADYPWRVAVPRAVWSRFAAEQAAAVDYPNFKSAVAAVNPARSDVYHRVWSDLLRIEDEDAPPGARRRAEPGDPDGEWEPLCPVCGRTGMSVNRNGLVPRHKTPDRDRWCEGSGMDAEWDDVVPWWLRRDRDDVEPGGFGLGYDPSPSR